MQKEMIFLFFVAAISLVALLHFSNTGAAVAGIKLKGDITDSLGNPVLTSRYNYWESAEGSVRTIPGKFDRIVAIDQNGRVVGEGKMEQFSYTLNILTQRQGVEIVHLKIGYYDPYRPETNSLVPCTTMTVAEIRSYATGSQNVVPMDIICDEMTALEKPSAVGYR